LNLIELIFALLLKLVPVNQVRLLQLQDQATTWYKNLGAGDPPTDEDGNPIEGAEPENRITALIKKYGEQWYTQVAFAISYIFLLRGITDYLEGTGDEDDDDDDDQD